ncbi:MAG: T9SS type A sorting domain-containing protein, partial [Leptospira sp.]|nr:T9SS type A sorting domain-containing protein [Leptospira sp.]
GPIGPGWSSRSTKYYIDGVDMISGMQYFRQGGKEIEDNSINSKIFQLFWVQKDSAGNVAMGAMSFSESSNIDSAFITNGILFPNEFLTKGYARSYIFEKNKSTDSVMNVSETVVTSAGTFNNCLKLSDTHYDSNGTAVFREFKYYAKGVGIVKQERTLPADQIHTDELTGYGTTLSPKLQEFPIATGPEHTFGGGGVFDGNKFLFGLVGDAVNKYNLGFQFVTSAGIQSGSRVSLGKNGSGLMVAFDGINYLMVWTDSLAMFSPNDIYSTGNIYGQFINTSGAFVGTTFTIASNVNRKFGQGLGGIIFKDTTYLVTYLKGGDHLDYLYGQRIGRSGNLLGSPIQISSHIAREQSIAFDGTNYLLAWCKVDHPAVDKDIYGQFVSSSGALVGSNFLIDGSQYASDNPVTMTFNGSRYLVLFHDQAADGKGWNMIGRFVTTAGTVAEKFMVVDSSKNPTYATAAFDGRNYLITWMESLGKMRVKGKYFDALGAPLTEAFTVFDTVGIKFPMGGVGGFGTGYFLLTATRLDTAMGNGDVVGMFLKTISTSVLKSKTVAPIETYSLSQNYPNPFNPTTVINYTLPNSGLVSLKVYDLLGREISTLVNEVQHQGDYSATFSGHNLSSGIYFYRLRVGSFIKTNKMVLIR